MGSEAEASAQRYAKRLKTAVEMARERYESHNLELVDDDGSGFPEITTVDGGYWIAARIFIDWTEVEMTAFPQAEDVTSETIRADIARAGTL